MIAIHHFYQQWHGFTGKKVFLQRLQFEYICIIYVNIFTKYITYDQDVPPCVGCKSSKSPEKEQKENKLQSIIDNHLVNYKPQKIQFIGCGCVYLRVDWEVVYKEKTNTLHLCLLHSVSFRMSRNTPKTAVKEMSLHLQSIFLAKITILHSSITERHK